MTHEHEHTFTTSIGWIKDTVMTAADPAIPTCWRRPGAAAADVAMMGDCCLFRLMVIYNFTQQLMVGGGEGGSRIIMDDIMTIR